MDRMESGAYNSKATNEKESNLFRSVEDYFARIEALLASLRSNLKKSSRPLAAATKSVKSGSLRKLQEASNSVAVALSGALEKANAAYEVASAFQPRYIEGQAYLEEICVAAERVGLSGVRCADHRITSSPVTATVEPHDYRLKVGRKRWDCLRPSAVAKELQRARNGVKGSSEIVALLEAIFQAHSLLTQGRHELSHSLDDIYRVMTLLPQVRRDYALDDFHADIVSLDDNGPRSTKSGLSIEFYADTAGKAGKGFRMTRADGSQKHYFGIAFEQER